MGQNYGKLTDWVVIIINNALLVVQPSIECINPNDWKLSDTYISKGIVKDDYIESDYLDPVINEDTLEDELLFGFEVCSNFHA